MGVCLAGFWFTGFGLVVLSVWWCVRVCCLGGLWFSCVTVVFWVRLGVVFGGCDVATVCEFLWFVFIVLMRVLEVFASLSFGWCV